MLRRLTERFNLHCVCILTLTPYVASYSPDDSTFNEFEFGGGGGHYQYQDCHGSTERDFADIGIRYSHKFSGPFRMGLASGVGADLRSAGNVYPIPFYPELALDWKEFSIGTMGVRVGDLDHGYMSLGLLDSAPPLSGRGFVNAGIGWGSPGLLSRVWLGTNVFPYETYGFALRPEFRLSENNFLFMTARYGWAKSTPEYGLSVGVRITSGR